MLPAEQRLHSGRDIATVSRTGSRGNVGDLTVTLLSATMTTSASGDVREPKAAVVVGRRAGGAVQRHRLQRRLRHVLRQLWFELPAGAQVVVRAGSGTAALDASGLEAATRTALTTAVRREGQRGRRG